MEKRCFNQQEAMAYLSVKRKFFDTHLSPRLKGVRAGTSMIYEKTDLDQAWDEYKLAAGSGGPEVKTWDAQVVSSQLKTVDTKSIRSTEKGEFNKVVSTLLMKRKAGLSAR